MRYSGGPSTPLVIVLFASVHLSTDFLGNNTATQPRSTETAEAVEKEKFGKVPDGLGDWKEVMRREQKAATSPPQ